MPEKPSSAASPPRSPVSAQNAMTMVCEKFCDAARLQMERNYSALDEAGEIMRNNGKIAAAATGIAVEGFGAAVKSAADMSRALIDKGLEISRIALDGQPMRALVESEESAARSVFTNVTDQLFGFSQAWLNTANSMMDRALIAAPKAGHQDMVPLPEVVIPTERQAAH